MRSQIIYRIVQCFCAIVWCGKVLPFNYAPSQTCFRASRISILFTVVRLTSPFSTLRKILLFVFVAFLVTWMILFAQIFWICEAEPGWKSEPRPQCDLGRDVAIAQIISELIAWRPWDEPSDTFPPADVLGDTILIIVPFQLVCRISLNRAQKVRILSIFSASAVTTIVCVAHSYYVLTIGGLREAVAGLVEVWLPL